MDNINITNLISVIIPVYNVAAFLNRCLQSVINQSYGNIEIILVDDGSTDGSGDVCDEYSKLDDRVKVIHTENRGLSAARNRGILESKGEWICFLDSDDWYEKSFCSKLIDFARLNDCDIVCCGIYTAYDEKNKLVRTHYSDSIFDNMNAQRALARYELMDYAWDKLYRKDLWQDVIYPEGFYVEDMGTTYKIFAKARRVGTVGDILYNYFHNANSISKTRSTKLKEDAFLMYRSRFEYYSKLYPDISASQEVELIRLAIRCITPIFKKDNYARTEAKKVIASKRKHLKLNGKTAILLFLYKPLCWLQYRKLL